MTGGCVVIFLELMTASFSVRTVDISMLGAATVLVLADVIVTIFAGLLV
jgi:hypothetical protein